MSQVIFFLTKLNNKSEWDKYEEWVRSTDIPAARALEGVQSYRVMRLESPVLDGVDAPGYDYIEVIEVESVDTYRAALASVDPALLEQFMGFIGELEVVAGTSID